MTPAGVGAIYERYDASLPWAVGLLMIIGIAMLVIVVTSGLTAAAKLDWLLSAKIGAVGFSGFLAWMVTTCLLILRQGGLPDSLAWFGLVSVGIVGVTVGLTIRFIRVHGALSGEVQPPAGLWSSSRWRSCACRRGPCGSASASEDQLPFSTSRE